MRTVSAATSTTAFPRSSAAWAADIRSLSDRLVAAQRPLRVLDAIKWDGAVERTFFAAGGRELPAVDCEYYAARPMPFEPGTKKQELAALDRDPGVCSEHTRAGPITGHVPGVPLRRRLAGGARHPRSPPYRDSSTACRRQTQRETVPVRRLVPEEQAARARFPLSHGRLRCRRARW